MSRCANRWVAGLGPVVGIATVSAVLGCGGDRPTSPATRATGAVASRASTPTQGCGEPDADPALVRDRRLAGAQRAGPLVIYPADGTPRAPAGDAVRAPKVVVVTAGDRPVTMTVDGAARARFSLLFGNAATGRAAPGLRVSDGNAAVRFPVCTGHPTGFRGGFLYRGAQCVPITVQADGGPMVHSTLAIGRPASACRRR